MKETYDAYSYEGSGVSEKLYLKFEPSEAVRELVRPFIKPSRQERDLAKVALYSRTKIPIQRFPAQRYTYHDSFQEYNELGRIEKQDLSIIAGRQLPLLAFFNIVGDQSDNKYLLFKVGLRADDRNRLGKISEFSSEAKKGVINTIVPLRADQAEQDRESIIRGAKQVASVMRLAHPALASIDESRRFVGSDYYTHLSSRGLQRQPSRS